MNLNAHTAQKVANALSVLDGLEKMSGLHLDLDTFHMALIDRDGDAVVGIEWDQNAGRYVAVRP